LAGAIGADGVEGPIKTEDARWMEDRVKSVAMTDPKLPYRMRRLAPEPGIGANAKLQFDIEIEEAF
jgi:hypothetical protein